MKIPVYIVPCKSYEAVPEALPKLLEMMGGLESFVKPRQKVLLKPNLLMAAAPEKMVTTHPSLVQSTGRVLQSLSAQTMLIDSPGAGTFFSAKTLKAVYQSTGMAEAAELGDIELLYDTSFQSIPFAQGRLMKQFNIINPVLDADVIINLCKFKTHTFLAMTGAVKNCFGVIPGLKKPGFHATLQDPALFAGMVLDLADFVNPTISIMDAVIGMQGNGPAAGTPYPAGYLIGSESPLAIDVLAGYMMGLSRENNPILVEAKKRDVRPFLLDHIEVVGETLKKLRCKDFKLPPTYAADTLESRFPPFIKKTLIRIFKSFATIKPVIRKNKCIACGSCVKACPVHVIDLDHSQYARIRHSDCIRCYCCHEMCPEDAIDLKAGVLHGVFR